MSPRSIRVALALALANAGCSSPKNSDLFEAGSTSSTTSDASPAGDSTDDGMTSSSTEDATISSVANTTAADGGTGSSTSASTGNTSTGGQSSTGEAQATSSSGGATSAASVSTSTTGLPCDAMAERCDGLDNDCDDALDEDGACPEYCTGASFEGHAYRFCVQPYGEQGERPERGFSRALYYCGTQGMLLPIIESAAENDFLYAELAHMEGEGPIWLGAVREDDLWSWVTGDAEEDWTSFYDADAEAAVDGAFNDWGEGEPSNSGSSSCGLVRTSEDPPSWAAEDCDEALSRIVCEEP